MLLDLHTILLDPVHRERIIVAMSTGGVYRTDDGGKTWQARNQGIRDRVVNEQGNVREHINIFVGDENIRFTSGLATPLRGGSEITIVPAVSGGAGQTFEFAGLPTSAHATQLPVAKCSATLRRRTCREIPKAGAFRGSNTRE